MAFDFKAFFRFTYLLLSKIGEPDFGWTARRAAIFVALYLVYPLLELGIWLNFLLDEVLFRKYRRVEVRSPVFIVGNFRSGTTFLHRLMARDARRFTTMKLWEILFTPSVLQRKVIDVLAALDRQLGSPVEKRVAAVEDQWEEQNVMHKAALREPEEDDYLLLHIWSALTIGLSSGILEAATPYSRFDTALPEAKRERITAFYRGCLQRHLYARSGGAPKQYLAKNPALTPKLDSLYQEFPDAKVVCLVRNPLEAVPSFVNMMQFSWRVVGAPAKSEAVRDFVVDMARHWYSYPLERLEHAPNESYILVRYDDLVADPEQTVRAIYQRFGFEIGPAFAQVLQSEAERARRYRSRHSYSLEQTGLTRERIVAEYQDIFDRFGFDSGEPEESAGPPETERPVPVSERRPIRPGTRRRRRPGVTTGSGDQVV